MSTGDIVDTRTLVNKVVLLNSYPQGSPAEENFAVQELNSSFNLRRGSNDVLLKILCSSVDPYLRLLMVENAETPFLEVFRPGKPLRAPTVGRVIASENVEFKDGDLVVGKTDVAEYTMVPGAEGLRKIDSPIAPPSCYLGTLGLSGLSAWVGLEIVGGMKEGDEVFISTAAGSVGIVAGQLAKLKGCRVVGSAGSDAKVKLLKELGFDDAFNYKLEHDWDAVLTRCFPTGIDLYFENVGGKMLEAVLNHMNLHGRIPVCGMISQYNQDWTKGDGVRNLFNLIAKSVRMEGFTMTNHADKWPAYITEAGALLQQGKLKHIEHISKGIQNYPKAFVGMMKGENFGKAVVQFVEDS